MYVKSAKTTMLNYNEVHNGTGDKLLFNPNSVNYILRYYFPYWSAEKKIKEVIEFCETTGTKYVMFVCGYQHMGWNMIPLDVARLETEKFIYARKELEKHDIKLGLDMGVTYGHHQNRWDHRDKFPDIKYWKTDIKGHADYSSPCPEDINLKKHVKQVYQIYAHCEPEYIYINDDLRFDVSDNMWGCFCTKHITLFSELTGRQWNCEELKNALYGDHNIRKQWIQMLGKCVVEYARDLTVAIHGINPKIRMGMMVPTVHLLPIFGHHLTNVLDALDGNVKPIVRPCIGPYQDSNRREIAGGIIYMELVKHFLTNKNVEYTPEIETAPFTRLSKSMTVVRFHIAQAILNGMTNPAIAPASYVGDPVDIEPEYIKNLPVDKLFYDSLCKMGFSTPGNKKGIQLVYDFNSAKESKAKIKSPHDLAWSSFVTAKILGSLGICYTLDESPVKLITGKLFSAISKKRIEDILKKGVILDAEAAEALIDLGYSSDIGINIGKEPEYWMAEECVDAEFNGIYKDTYIPLKAIKDSIYKLLPFENAKVISQIVDADRQRVCSGIVLYQNSRGGRIAILPYSISADDGDNRHLLCYQRRYMFRKIIEWMNADVLPVFVEEPTDFLVQCWDNGQVLTVCLTNLSYDSFSEVKVIFTHKEKLHFDEAVYVSDNGTLNKLQISLIQSNEGDGHICKIKHEFSAFRPLIMRIPYV